MKTGPIVCALSARFAGSLAGVEEGCSMRLKPPKIVPEPPLSLLWERKIDAAPMGKALNAAPLVMQMSTWALRYMHLMHTAESGLGKRPLTAAFVGLRVGGRHRQSGISGGKKRPSLRGIAVQKGDMAAGGRVLPPTRCARRYAHVVTQ